MSGVDGDLDPRPQRELDEVLIEGAKQDFRELREGHGHRQVFRVISPASRFKNRSD